MQQTTSRRAVLAGLAVTPALAASTLTLAAATVAGHGASLAAPDPIFAAIERHQALNAAFRHTLRLKDKFERDRGFADASPEHDELERREDESGNAESAACDEMVATVPTTFAGVLGLLRYVEQRHAKGDKILDEGGLEEVVSTTISALASIGAVS